MNKSNLCVVKGQRRERKSMVIIIGNLRILLVRSAVLMMGILTG